MADTDTPDVDADRPPDAMGTADAVAAQAGDLRCCCGREDCVFLRHNCSVLLSVERDVHAAAKMGQTLLARHEAYMASAERDRLELIARIEQLERDNADLEVKNKSVTDESQTLREELEQLNEAITEAETKTELLEASLRESQGEVQRLEIAADTAAGLERQIAVLEEEQVVLRTTITRTQEEARMTIYRWRRAEKGLSDLQEQLERMEKEAREERERHIEVIGRMERQRAMERELDTAAGRLKGAAAAKSMADSRNRGSAVSRFLRDLLQDNANLRLGIAELREMLLGSNDEIQILREQLMYHQPAAGREPSAFTTLQAELAKKEPPTPPQPPGVSQELHIHHHYHVAPRPEARKPRKRRQGITPGPFIPPQFSAAASPVISPASWQRGALRGHATDSPVPSSGRWSLQSEQRSEFVSSSARSSPQSVNGYSLFDRTMDLPSPGSPTTSVDPASPSWKSARRKRASEFSLRGISKTAMLSTGTPIAQSSPPAGYTQQPRPLAHLIFRCDSAPRDITAPYTTDDIPSSASALLAQSSDNDSTNAETVAADALSPTAKAFDPAVQQLPRGLRRTVSHESVLSLSNGLDIHTLKSRPSQLALRRLGLSAASTNLSDVIARPTLSRGSAGGKRGSVILRDSIALSRGLPVSGSQQGGGARAASNPVQGRGRDKDSGGRDSSRAPSALGKLVSWRLWGGGANSTDANADASPDTSTLPVPASSSPSHSPSLSPPLPAATATPTPSLPLPVPLPSQTGATSPPATEPALSIISGKSPPPPPQGSVPPSTAVAVPFRAPGLNQPGAVPGFQAYHWAAHRLRGAPSKVAVGDGERGQVTEALREVLDEGVGAVTGGGGGGDGGGGAGAGGGG